MTPTQRKAVEQALHVIDRMEQSYGNLWQVTASPEELDELCAALRAALAEQPALTATYTCGVCGVSMQMEQPAEQEPVAQRWQPIETAPKGRIVLVYYKNSLGNGRTMRARYYLPETLDSDTTESGWADEGWYEESEAYEYLMPLEHDPTHWMPLPAGPDTAPRPTKPAEQEPVAWMYFDSDGDAIFGHPNGYRPDDAVPVYTAPQPAIPPGYKLVPVEPTIAMLMAGRSRRLSLEHDTEAAAVWAAMLAAAPEAPQPAKRVQLTDEEISALWLDSISGPLTATKFARAVERAHGITGDAE